MTQLPPLAILAGGLATRLRPLTEKIPKSMLELAGEPFIAHQLRLLRKKGASRVVLCTGYLGEMVEAFVGDGSQFGLSVSYSNDGDKLLGTGGALKQALPLLGEHFLVIYGDSWLDTDYGAIADTFERDGRPALMTVFRNENAWDTSNVEFDGTTIRQYDKKVRTPRMLYIDWGLGILKREVFDGWDGAFDLADVYRGLVEQGRLIGYEVKERFYEIGSHSGLSETEALLKAAAAS